MSSGAEVFDAAIPAGFMFMLVDVIAGTFGIELPVPSGVTFCLGVVFVGIGGVARAVRS